MERFVVINSFKTCYFLLSYLMIIVIVNTLYLVWVRARAQIG